MFKIFLNPSMVYVFQISARFFKILYFFVAVLGLCCCVGVFLLQLVRATPEPCAGFSLCWLLLM